MTNIKQPSQSFGLPKEYQEVWTEFLGCRIDLSKHPLIPRPETEWWSEKVIEDIKSRGRQQILDMFTGSACIGIAVATHCTKSKVLLTDKTNYVATPLPSNATFRESNLFDKISANERFDFILANPPYVPTQGPASRAALAGPSIMDHEPAEALYAGKEGLDVIRPFLEQAPKYLNQRGQIWMEFGSEQKEAVTNLLRDFNYYQNFNCTFHKDQHNKWRYLVARLQN